MRMVEPDAKCRSYVNKERLVTEVRELLNRCFPEGTNHVDWVPYPLPSGRWTAIFFLRQGATHCAFPIANHGYLVIG